MCILLTKMVFISGHQYNEHSSLTIKMKLKYAKNIN